MHCLVKNYGGNSLQQLAKETYAVKKVIFSNNHHKKKYMKKLLKKMIQEIISTC